MCCYCWKTLHKIESRHMDTYYCRNGWTSEIAARLRDKDRKSQKDKK